MSYQEEPPEGCRPAPRVSLFTLGCRLNQHDTAAMRGDLERAGWRVEDAGGSEAAAGTERDGAGAEPRVLVVNTCTVTRRADQESRQLIRRLARERPGVPIVVTGCYAQRAPEEIRTLPGVALVLGTAERESLAARLGAAGWARPAAADPRAAAAPVSAAPGRARREAAPAPSPLEFGRARALLKVQDGCDTFCGYCIVPYVRGRARSVPFEEVLAQGRRLLGAGFREIVLTGADLGAYRGGAGRASDLTRLVEALLALEGPHAHARGRGHRVRLSSIEPNKVDDSLVDLLAREPRLCRHLHLPLQSGSGAVLRAMRRAYAPRDYARLVERVAAAGPVAIGADVIVGFPGEGDREFAETVAFLESLPIAFLHVFRYSPRPGTRAAGGGDPGAPGAAPLPPAVRDRAARLRHLGARRARAFARSLVGTVRGVVMEGRRARDGSPVGTSDLYAPVALTNAPKAPERGLVGVRIAAYDGEILRGEALREAPAFDAGVPAER